MENIITFHNLHKTLVEMSRNYKFRNQELPYFISFATVHWIDVLIRPEYKEIIAGSMNYCIKEKGLIVYAYVIMTSHVHMVIGTRGKPMQDIVRDLKRHTSKTIIKAIEESYHESRKECLPAEASAQAGMLWMFSRAGKKNCNNSKYQFWQQHNKPIELTCNFMIDQKIDYLHNNPVAEGTVFEAHEYRYSSAVDYAGGKGEVNVELLL